MKGSSFHNYDHWQSKHQNTHVMFVYIAQASKDSVTQLQSKANLRPNLQILSKLKEQMAKIQHVRVSKQAVNYTLGCLAVPRSVTLEQNHKLDVAYCYMHLNHG